MSTARQVVDPYPLTTATATGRAGRAAVRTNALRPETSPAWWWGVAPGALYSVGNTTAPVAPPPPAEVTDTPPATTSSSDCGCG